MQFLRLFITQFKAGWSAYRRAIPFIQKHKLWLGLTRAKWLIRLLLIFAVLISLNFTLTFWRWMSLVDVTSIQTEHLNLSFDLSFEDLYHPSGGLKYLILLSMHILISAFGGRTSEVLQGQVFEPTFAGYLKGKWRGLLVVIRNFAVELILIAVITVALKLISLGFIKNAAIFVIQSYLLGFIVLDTANSRLNMSIRQSAKRIRSYAGLSVAIGLGLYLLLLIPIAGAVIAPCVASVAAVLALFELEKKEVAKQINLAIDKKEYEK